MVWWGKQPLWESAQVPRDNCTHLVLVRLYSKSSKLGFQSPWTKNFLVCQAGFRKGRGTRDQIANLCWILEKGKSGETSTSVSLSWLKPLTVWIITNCGKLLKRWEHQTILSVSRETYMGVKKQELGSCMEQVTGSELRKEYDKAVTVNVFI